MQIYRYPGPGGVETRNAQTEIIEWDSLDAEQKSDYLGKATTSGSGALTRLTFNTVDNLETVFYRSGWLSDGIKNSGFKALLDNKIVIQTIAFQTHLDNDSLPTDVVRLLGITPGGKSGAATLGTVPAEQFRATFMELFS